MAYRPKILVVEDDAATLRLLDATLKTMGASPRCLPSAKQAAEVVNREKFDGVFVDWEMSEMSGEELTTRIRGSKTNASVPITMLTESRNPREIAKGFKAGVTFYLTKPVGQKELARLLNASRGAMLAERRRYERVKVTVGVECRWEEKQAKGQMVNLSVSGVLVSVAPAPGVGAGVEVAFALPGSRRPLQLKGSVMRQAPGNQVGIRFVRVPAEEREALEQFIERSLPGAGT